MTSDFVTNTGCIEINASDVQLDCDLFTLTGNNSNAGILISDKNNVAIKNCIVNNFSVGIQISNSANISISSSFLEQNSIGVNTSNTFSINISSSTLNGNSGFNLINTIPSPVEAANNYWGTTSPSEILATISGEANFQPFLSNDPFGDSDGDIIRDFKDNCPSTINPDQADSDRDGKGDKCDINVMLNAFVFDPLFENISIEPSLISPEYGLFVVQLHDTSIRDSTFADINAAMLGIIPQNAYLVQSASTKSQIQANSNVRWVEIFHPAFKLSSGIYPTVASGLTTGNSSEYQISYLFGNKEIVNQSLVALGSSILYEFDGIFNIIAPDTILKNISKIQSVLLISAYEAPTYKNDVARIVTGVESLQNGVFGIPFKGEGELVDILDSGLDSAVKCSGIADCNTKNPNIFKDFKGRIREIRNTTGPGDAIDTNEHGTHVAGTAVGDGANSGGIYRGAAPLSEFMMQQRDGNERSGLSYAIGQGYKIHSNSWGGTECAFTYKVQAQSLDKMLYENQWSAFIFAAGNEEQNPCNATGANSIQPESIAKNVITVGATESFRTQPAPSATGPLAGFFLLPSLTTRFKAIGAPFTYNGGFGVGPIIPDTDDNEDIAGFSSRGRPVSPLTANTVRVKPDIVAPGHYIVSTRSSVCQNDVDANGDNVTNSSDCVGRGQVGGPVYGYGSNYVAVDIFNSSGAQIFTQLPIRASDIAGLIAHMNTNLLGSPFSFNNSVPIPSNPNLAGNSAYKEYYTYLSGTSMATPHVSGALALVLEYNRKMQNHPNSSASLMKAMIINGARNIGGQGTAAQGTTTNAPNNDQGWGLLDMPSTLFPLSRHTTLVFSDNEAPSKLTSAGDQVSYTSINTIPMRFSKKSNLSITLVWADQQAAGLTDSLINDLDLIVTAPNGDVYYGNIFNAAGFSVKTTVNPGKDAVNNVEKVKMKDLTDGFYNVTVKAATITGNPQKFALVVAPVVGADSANQIGNYNYNFSIGEEVYVKAVGLPNGTSVNVYVIEHTGFTFGTELILSGLDKSERNAPIPLQTSQLGTLEGNLIWKTASSASQILSSFATNNGRYHIVIDVDNDGKFKPGIDVVDYHDKAGFEVKCNNPANGNTCGAIDNSDSTGKIVEIYNKEDPVYAKAAVISINQARVVKVFTVKGKTISPGTALQDVSGSPEQVNLAKGVLYKATQLVWSPELVGGDYTLVIDVDNNGLYDQNIDIIDPDGFAVLGAIDQVRFAVDSFGRVHAVGIEHGTTTKLLYGSVPTNRKFKVDKKHPEYFDWSTDNPVKWTMIREGGKISYASPDIAVDSKGNPFLIAETHTSGFNWLIFYALNGKEGSEGKRNMNWDIDSFGNPNPSDVLVYHFADFEDASLMSPRIAINPKDDMPVITSKVSEMFPDQFYFEFIYPSVFQRLEMIAPVHPLVPIFYTLGIVAAPAVYFGDSVQIATYDYGGTGSDGGVRWPFGWDKIDPDTGEITPTMRSYRYAFGEMASAMFDVAGTSPRDDNWHWAVIDENRGINDFAGPADIAIDKDGNAHVAYFRYEIRDDFDSPYTLFYKKIEILTANNSGHITSTPGRYTQPSFKGVGSASSLGDYPAIDVDSNKVAHIAWQAQDQIRYARLDVNLVAGALGDEVLMVDNSPPAQAKVATLSSNLVNSKPDIVVDSKGNPTVLFRDYSPSGPATLFLSNSNSTSSAPSFGAPAQIINVLDYTNDPQIGFATLERNIYENSFFDEKYLGWTEIDKSSRNMKYKKTLPHLTVLLVVDGLDSSTFQKQLGDGNLPNIEKLITSSSSLQGKASVPFPDNFFPSYGSILTGNKPGKHLVPGNEFSDAGSDKDFITNPPDVNTYLTAKGVSTIFDYLEDNGKHTASVAAVIHKGVSATAPSKIVQGSIDFNAGQVNNYNEVINYLDFIKNRDDDPLNDAPDLLSIYLLGNDHGKSTAADAMSYADVDNKVGEIVKKLADKKILNSTVFLITSPTGYQNVLANGQKGDAIDGPNNFILLKNGKYAFNYLGGAPSPADMLARALAISSMNNNPGSTVYDSIDKIYVKSGTGYKLLQGISLIATSADISALASSASGDIILVAKPGKYFSNTVRKAIDGAAENKVPLIIAGPFYQSLINKSASLKAPIALTDVAKTLAYMAGGESLANGLLVDGRNIFTPQLLVITGSPVNLHLYDSQGAHIGMTPSGEVEENIDTGTYELDNRSMQTTISLLEAPDKYKILIEAYDTGHFTLRLIKDTENESYSIVFPTIDIINGSIATLDQNSLNPLSLDFDYDGNSVPDTSFRPATYLQVIPGNGSAKIIIDAEANQSLDINLLESLGLQIFVNTSSKITGGIIDVSRAYDDSFNSSGFLALPQVITFSSPNGIETSLSSMNFKIVYEDALRGAISENGLALFRLNLGVPALEGPAIFDPEHNTFENVTSFGSFIIAGTDFNPLITNLIVTPKVSTISGLPLHIVMAAQGAITSADINFEGSNYALVQNGSVFETTITGPLIDGVYPLHGHVVDIKGNEAEADIATFTLDTIAPNVTIISPAQGAIFKNTSVLVEWKTNERT
ncbi:MAG: S8 family serine peptidase, partial [Nanoarchaeota archaeon]